MAAFGYSALALPKTPEHLTQYLESWKRSDVTSGAKDLLFDAIKMIVAEMSITDAVVSATNAKLTEREYMLIHKYVGLFQNICFPADYVTSTKPTDSFDIREALKEPLNIVGTTDLCTITLTEWKESGADHFTWFGTAEGLPFTKVVLKLRKRHGKLCTMSREHLEILKDRFVELRTALSKIGSPHRVNKVIILEKKPFLFWVEEQISFKKFWDLTTRPRKDEAICFSNFPELVALQEELEKQCMIQFVDMQGQVEVKDGKRFFTFTDVTFLADLVTLGWNETDLKQAWERVHSSG